MNDRPLSTQPGQAIILQGRYELVGLLGQGGMGTVYMARDLHLSNRPCVVKKLRDDFYKEEDQQKAVVFFKREANVLSRLQHVNIVHILDYFEENYDYFLVLEYVEGSDLHNILHDRGHPFVEEQVVGWALEICEVLQYLHEHDPPVIYRDLKPSNIMIDLKGRVKLVDFGIARHCENSGDMTHVISAGYSPPEQYWGAADKRSDVYALGATMYFLLTGTDPEALKSSSPLEVNPEVSEHTDEIVRTATDQDPSKRFQTIDEMKAQLAIKPKKPFKLPIHQVKDSFIGMVMIAMALVFLFALKTAEDVFVLAGKKIDHLQRKFTQVSTVADPVSLPQSKQPKIIWSKPSGKSKGSEPPAGQIANEEDLTDLEVNVKP